MYRYWLPKVLGKGKEERRGQLIDYEYFSTHVKHWNKRKLNAIVNLDASRFWYMLIFNTPKHWRILQKQKLYTPSEFFPIYISSKTL